MHCEHEIMTRTLRAFIVILGVMALARAVDYLTGSPYNMDRIWDDDLTLPLVWGIGCAVSGLLHIVSAWRKYTTLALWAAAVGLAVNIGLAYQVYDVRMLPWPWPPEDHRLVTDHLGHAALSATVGICVAFRVRVAARREEIIEMEGARG